MSTLDTLFDVLVCEDPRRSADRILTGLIRIHRARGGAVLRPRGGQMEIWMSSSLSLEGLGELPVRWADHREMLATGRPVIEPGFALVPAMLGPEMVAVLYLAQPRDLSPSDAQVFAAPIAHAVRAAEADTGTDHLQRVNPADEPKLRLLRLLERNEWNVASVARQLGVSRRTVYLRLRAFGIERKRVPKLYKKLPAEG